MKRKRVHVTTNGPLPIAPSIEIGWEDVWLRVCSGRRTLRLAPCLVSREHLRSDIHMAEECAKDPESSVREIHLRDAAELKEILRKIDVSGYAVDQVPKTARRGRDPGRNFAVLASVYTNKAWITKAEAERMLDFYLATIGLRNCVYKWKMPRLIAWPTTIPAP